MQSKLCMLIPAFSTESLITLMAHVRWCAAVSRGRNPSPGGGLYVCRILLRIAVVPLEECLTIPEPSLFADPSRPRANRSLYGGLKGSGRLLVRTGICWIFRSKRQNVVTYLCRWSESAAFNLPSFLLGPYGSATAQVSVDHIPDIVPFRPSHCVL
jgi:hypothetical protein